MAKASEPDNRITAMAPIPWGVAKATMVSSLIKAFSAVFFQITLLLLGKYRQSIIRIYSTRKNNINK